MAATRSESEAPRATSAAERREAGALLTAVGVAAVSGIVYELLLGTSASFLVGDSITEWSLTIGTFLAAMGVGSFWSRFVEHNLLRALIAVEVTVALIGGFSVLLLFAVFAWAEPVFRPALYCLILVIGALVGLEIPLLTRAIRRYGSLRTVLSSVLAIDYGGALIASLIYPLFLYPLLGLARTAFVASMFNLLGVALILYAYRRERGLARSHLVATLTAALLLVAGLAGATSAVRIIDARLYRPEQLVFTGRSPYQQLALTVRESGGVQLYLNGHLQFRSDDEARYHEPLVHVPMSIARDPTRVLVLGGGDGLAVRELLKYESMESVVVVDIDPLVTSTSRTHPLVRTLNEGALDDPRVRVVNEDAPVWLRSAEEDAFDVVLVDLPDPSTPALARLYTVQLYRLAAARLRPDGVLGVQAGSPFYARRAYWCIVATLEAAGLHTLPYRSNVPSFGEWGFVAAAATPLPDPSSLRIRVPTRYLDDRVLPTLFVFPQDMSRVEEEPSTLFEPRILRLFQSGWRRHVF